jgi:hypothetical protein
MMRVPPDLHTLITMTVWPKDACKTAAVQRACTNVTVVKCQRCMHDGHTLQSIAGEYRTDYLALYSMNVGIPNPDRCSPLASRLTLYCIGGRGRPRPRKLQTRRLPAPWLVRQAASLLNRVLCAQGAHGDASEYRHQVSSQRRRRSLLDRRALFHQRASSAGGQPW